MNLKRKILVVSIFAIAMVLFEAAVVIYLRELLYPGGFSFPLVPIPESIALTEILREASTLVMLITAGILAGKTFSGRFAWFIYSFAIWDIFYYVFLKLLIGWPESFMTWDILFLIPTTWIGPVVSPIIISFTMIALALVILINAANKKSTRVSLFEWGIFTAGSLVLIFGFVLDYSGYMLSYFSVSEMFRMKDPEIMQIAFAYVPGEFPWKLFFTGEIIIIAGIIKYGFRLKHM